MKTLVLWNAKASRAAESSTLRRRIERDITSRLIETSSGEEARRLAREHGGPGALVVAAGGDGTVNHVLQGLVEAGAQATLGILPLGTGNDFSRDLGLPLEPREVWELLRQLPAVRVDLGRARSNGTERIFCNSANYGNSSRLLQRVDQEFKQRWGALSYLKAGTELLSDLDQFDVQLQLDDEPPTTFHALNVIVANTRSAGGGARIAPRASLSDGLLDVIVITEASFAELASAATGFMLGDYLDRDCVTFERARRVRVTGDQPIPLIVDGEPLDGTHYQLEAMPGAVHALVGPAFAEDSASD